MAMKKLGKDFIYTLMTESTSGICLHYYKYSDSSVIAKIFTEKFGLRSFVLKGLEVKNPKTNLIFYNL